MVSSLTEAEKAACVELLKAYAAKWQVVQRSQWKYQFHGSVLVRVLRNVRMREDEIKNILTFLNSDDCIATLSLYDQSLSSEWKTTRAWIEAGGTASGQIAGINLYHGIRIDPNDGAKDGAYVTDDGCTYKVDVTYYWSQATAPSVPKSTSGEMYSVSSLSRDQETGLYTYAIEHRTRIQQDVEFTAEDTALSTKKDARHIGVKEANKSKYANKAGVSNGTVTTVSVSKNSDCTSDIGIQETKRKNVVVSESTTENAFSKRTSSHKQANKVKTTAKLPSNGVVQSVTNTLREDGTYDTEVTDTTEKSVSDAEVTTQSDFFGTTTRKTNRATSATPTSSATAKSISSTKTDGGLLNTSVSETTENNVPGASEQITKDFRGTSTTTTNRGQDNKITEVQEGESVTNERTATGKWTTRIAKFFANAVDGVRTTLTENAFSRVFSKVSIALSKPADVSYSGNGLVRRQTVSRNTNNTYDVEVTETQEKSVMQASVRKTKTLHGIVTEIIHKGQHGNATDPSSIGESVTNTKTESGLVDQNIRKLQPQSCQGILQSATEDALSRQDTITNLVTEKPSLNVTAPQGTIKQVTIHANDDGTFDEKTTTHTAKAFQETIPWTTTHTDSSGNQTQLQHKRTTFRNAASVPSVENYAGTTSLSFQKNQFGLYDGYIQYDEVYVRNSSGSGYQTWSKSKKVRVITLESGPYPKPKSRKYYAQVTYIDVLEERHYTSDPGNRGNLSSRYAESYSNPQWGLVPKWNGGVLTTYKLIYDGTADFEASSKEATLKLMNAFAIIK